MEHKRGEYKDKSYKAWCPNCKEETTFIEYLDREGGYLRGVICEKCDDDRQQKSPAIYNSRVYREKCKCGKEIIALTQGDRSPEYYTEVGIICDCKETVWLNLPVN